MQEQARIDPTTVVGWGVDADPRNDPTYPMRQRPDDATADQALTWERPPLQPQSVEVLASTEHNRRTAVFGTSTPPSGLSGAIRRRAYHQSEGKWGHWLMLLLADRIDVVEGLVADLGHGRVPNILGEMGIRSEIRHNPAGLARKVIFTAAAAAAAVAIVRQVRARREQDNIRPSQRAMRSGATAGRRRS